MDDREAGRLILREAVVRLRRQQEAAGLSEPRLSLHETRSMAESTGQSRRDVEMAALRHGLVPTRYARNIGTVGSDGQVRLLGSQVAVVGCGGLGGWVTEILARMGIGRLVLVDGDCFAEDNLNRQVGCVEDTLGRHKVQVLAERVDRINSAVDVRAEGAFLTPENASVLLQGSDVVVDGLDTLPARLVLEDAVRSLRIPLVHAAIGGYSGQVMTVYPDDPGLRALYGDNAPVRGVEATLGNPSATPMMLAAWQAHEVVKVILGTGELVRRRLLIMDAEFGDVTHLDLSIEGA